MLRAFPSPQLCAARAAYGMAAERASKDCTPAALPMEKDAGGPAGQF